MLAMRLQAQHLAREADEILRAVERAAGVSYRDVSDMMSPSEFFEIVQQ